MNSLAIIPARSGSKGLKNKNIKLLNGKPLLTYTIEAAKASGLFNEIMVSTDSSEYAEVAKQWGASVPFLRDKILSSDESSSWDVVKDVLKKYEKLGKEFEVVALLQPTSPLRTANDIIEGYKILKDKDANFVVSVCEMEHSPLWANRLPADCSMKNFIRTEFVNMPRQNIPKHYRINGAIYIIKVNYLKESKEIYGEKSYATIMKKENSIDIDDQIDFTMAEVLMSELRRLRHNQ